MPVIDAPAWVKDSIFYQIFPERFANGDASNDPAGTQPWGAPPTRENFFGGDLRGILQRLPYLEELGINAIYLTPVFKARTNHKYDTCDYLEIDPAFGDKALFRRLVDAAHNLGIRVVLDAVFNHCGDGFPPFQDLMRNREDSAYKDWFFPQGFPISQTPPNYQTCGGAVYLPKLNLANPETAQYLLDVAAYWIEEFGIDGWRLDTPWKTDYEFWPRFRERVKRANPEAYIVAETWRDSLHWLQGDTCDGVMNYPLRDALLDYCAYDHMDGEDFDHFSRRLLESYGAAVPFLLNLIGSHDTPRLLSLCAGDVQRACVAIVAQFTQPGAPLIYYGDEVGMLGENDPDCRRCMLWDSQDWNQTIHATYRTMIRARHAHPALREGALEKLLVFNGVYAFRRCLGEENLIVVLNPREEQRDLRIPLPEKALQARAWRDLLNGRTFLAGESLVLDVLPQKSALVLV
jgi:cyclomaltodextrinase